MTLDLIARYPSQVITTDPDYPLGKARNVGTPGDGTGTPWEADLANDLHGSIQALLAHASVTASGDPDRVGASNVVDSIVALIGTPTRVQWRKGIFSAGETLNVAPKDAGAMQCLWNPTGTKFYFLGTATGAIYEYACSFPYELTSAVYTDSYTIAQGSGHRTFAFNDTGTKFFVGTTSHIIYQYSCTAYDISTATYDSVSYTVPSPVSSLYGLFWHPNGGSFFVVDPGATTSIRQYTVSTPFTLTGAAYASVAFDYSAQGNQGSNAAWNADGTRLFMIQKSTNRMCVYTLSTAYDISTAAFEYSAAVPAGTNGITLTGTLATIIGETTDLAASYYLSRGEIVL